MDKRILDTYTSDDIISLPRTTVHFESHNSKNLDINDICITKQLKPHNIKRYNDIFLFGR